RGFRIELGEIEHSLAMLAGVDSALVIAQMQGDSKQLVGYVKPTEKVKEEVVGDYVNRIKTTLRKTLPEYMVPGVILLVTEWPLTSNGKVDRKALPKINYVPTTKSFIATTTEMEELLVKYIHELLLIDKDAISVGESLITLGFNSILSLHLSQKLSNELNISSQLALIMESGSIRELAMELDFICGSTPIVRAVEVEEEW
ncbi:phosphopantetheine-binding protein, partial [Pseudoalteromonas piscicida]|uniref:AMP-binding enzyme n=2 Tax=Pseudoalteromonas TaxID=53246 RepID=UPI001EFCAF14